MHIRRPPRSLLLPLLFAPLALIAQGPVTRDSAGIHIIENAKPIWTAAQMQHLAPTPSLVIGTQSGPNYEFSRIAGAARMSDGRIVVADGGSLQLRFYDSTGRFIKSSGRSGDGPGEFRQLLTLEVLAGDTLAAGSPFGVTSLFDGSGGFVRTWPAVVRPKYALFTLNTGRRAVTTRTIPAGHVAGTQWVDSLPVVFADARNVETKELGRFPMLRFDRVSVVWLSPMGMFATNGSHFFIGYGGEYPIRAYTAGGTLERIIRRRWAPVKVTGADWQTFVADWSKRWIKTTGPEAEKEIVEMRGAPYSRTLPAFSQFIADRTGRLWAREPHIADAPAAGQLNSPPLVPTVWSVFDAQGRWLEDVTMPARFMPMEIGANYVLGVARDADGVETVVMYRLQ